jgi:hypothetical protein
MIQPTLQAGVAPRRPGGIAIVAMGAIVVLGILGMGLLVLSILGLFGLVNTPLGPVRQHLSAADLASSAVAGVTLMLAVFTAYLAIATRASVAATTREAAIAEQGLAAAQEQARIGAEQVVATNRHAKLAQETLEASWRPFLVNVPWGYLTRPSFMGTRDAAQIEVYKDDQGAFDIDVPLRNIGSGPALITKAGMSLTQLHSEAVTLSSAIVASGEIVRVGFRVQPESAACAPRWPPSNRLS